MLGKMQEMWEVARHGTLFKVSFLDSAVRYYSTGRYCINGPHGMLGSNYFWRERTAKAVCDAANAAAQQVLEAVHAELIGMRELDKRFGIRRTTRMERPMDPSKGFKEVRLEDGSVSTQPAAYLPEREVEVIVSGVGRIESRQTGRSS